MFLLLGGKNLKAQTVTIANWNNGGQWCSTNSKPSIWTRHKLTTAGDEWTCGSTNSEANAYYNNRAVDEYLVSGAINFNDYKNERLKLSIYKQYGDQSGYGLHIMYSTNYSGTGSPSSATWTPIYTYFGNTQYSGHSFNVDVAMPNIQSNKVYIAVRYNSSGSSANRACLIRVSNFRIEGEFDDLPKFTIREANTYLAQDTAVNYNFGKVDTTCTKSLTKRFYLKNISDLDFTVSATPDNSSDYKYSNLPSGNIAKGDSVFFDVTFEPKDLKTLNSLLKINTSNSKSKTLKRDINYIGEGTSYRKFFDAGTNDEICFGESIEIGSNTNDTFNYYWFTKDSGFISNMMKPIVKPSKTTVYYVIAFNNQGNCVDSSIDSIRITVNPIPTINLNKDTAICKGEFIRIGDALYDNAMNYKISTIPASSEFNSHNLIVAPTVRTGYIISKTNKTTGCSITDTTFVNPIDKPEVNLGSDKVVCDGDSITLIVKSYTNSKYSWFANGIKTNDTNNSIVVKPSQATEYVVINNTIGCAISDTIMIDVNAKPSVFAGNDTTVCPGEKVRIGENPEPGFIYYWNSSTGFVSQSAKPLITVNQKGFYALSKRSIYTNCISTDTIEVDIFSRPTANAGKDTTVGKDVQFTINIQNNPALRYEWTSFPQGFSSNVANPTLSLKFNTFLILKVSDTSNGCGSIDTVVYRVADVPFVNVGGNKSICLGDSVQIGSNTIFGNTYQWTSKPAGFNSTKANPFVKPSVNTTYYLTQTLNSTQMTAKDSVFVEVNNIPEAELDEKVSICKGESVILKNSKSEMGVVYSWTDNRTTNAIKNVSSININPTQTTTYYLRAENAGLCFDIDSTVVSVNELPYAAYRTIKNKNSVSFVADTRNSSYGYVWNVEGTNYSGSDSFYYYFPNTGKYVVALEVESNEGCKSTYTDTVEINSISNVSELANNNFIKVYPNPIVKGNILTIELNNPEIVVYQLSLVDVSGKNIDFGYQTNASMINVSLDNKIEAGSYIVKIITNKGVINEMIQILN